MIPYSDVIKVASGLIGAAGTPSANQALALSTDAALPFGQAVPFVNATDVSNFFGATSQEAILGAIYFKGHDNSFSKPGKLYFGRWATTAQSGFMRGGSLAAVTLTQAKAIAAGTLTITVDGVARTSASITYSAATSFSNLASLIQTAFTPAVLLCTFDAQRNALVFTSPTTGATSNVSYATGTGATVLRIDSAANGAVISDGQAIPVVGTVLNKLKEAAADWNTLLSVQVQPEPTSVLMADWQAAQDNRFIFIAHSATPLTLAATLGAASYNGVSVAYSAKTAFMMAGSLASIDYTRTNGYTTLAHKTQSGLAPEVTDQATAATLEAAKISFYGQYGEGNNLTNRLMFGQCFGLWPYLDMYAAQVRLCNQIRLSGWALLGNLPSVPYGLEGDSYLMSVCNDPIGEAINHGTIEPGIEIDSVQKSTANALAGADIAQQLQSAGYVVRIQQATAQQRAQRVAGAITIIYQYGGSVHRMTVASVGVI